MTEVSLTTIVSNYANKLDFLGEDGMSLYINYKDKSLLFNTGTGESVLVNGVRLGIDFSEIDAVFLSHGFRSTAGGLPGVLALGLRKCSPILKSLRGDTSGTKATFSSA